jgi:hypothetical protein
MTVPGLPPLFTTALNTAEGSLAFLWFGMTGVLMIKYGKEKHKVKIRNV